MSRTIRVYWPARSSSWVNFNWPPIDAKSVVTISVSEGDAHFGGFGDTLDHISRRRGAAVMGIRNITPHNGGVEFYVEIGWDSPLNIVTDITVHDPPEQGHFA
jgi:hypothetical protein